MQVLRVMCWCNRRLLNKQLLLTLIGFSFYSVQSRKHSSFLKNDKTVTFSKIVSSSRIDLSSR